MKDSAEEGKGLQPWKMTKFIEESEHKGSPQMRLVLHGSLKNE
jgi:hypothetical protein